MSNKINKCVSKCVNLLVECQAANKKSFPMFISLYNSKKQQLWRDERYRDRNGETRENTEWHNIVAWRNTADVVERFVKKGTQLYIEGRIRTRSWDDQNGNKRFPRRYRARKSLLSLAVSQCRRVPSTSLRLLRRFSRRQRISVSVWRVAVT